VRLVDETEASQQIVDFRDFPGLSVRGAEALRTDRLQLPGQFQRQLHARQVQPALFDKIFHLTKLLNVAIRIQAQVAGCARGGNQTLALVFA
jgi:hypothetical protein